MNVLRVSKFEFVRNTSKYLKGETVIITHNGEDCLRLGPVTGYEKEYKFRSQQSEKEPETATKVATLKGAKNIKAPVKKFGEHGCGCPKVEGKFLCKIHGRV